ncbi:MAG: cytochrome c biogenesis heme-transporting ATPase CcmA [Pseudomonadota bacterium]
MTNSAGSPRLAAHDLMVWRGDRCLFRELSFHAAAGEAVVITGPNGAGKTTLLRSLCGLTTTETGHVSWDGQPIGAGNIEFQRALAWLGHRDGLKGDLTPRENLLAAWRLHSPDLLGRVDDYLDNAGVTAQARLPVARLSAGQRRRVALARTLGLAAALWILDEPVANLDVAGREWAQQQICEHVERGGIAVMSTHHPVPLDGITVHSVQIGTA